MIRAAVAKETGNERSATNGDERRPNTAVRVGVYPGGRMKGRVDSRSVPRRRRRIPEEKRNGLGDISRVEDASAREPRVVVLRKSRKHARIDDEPRICS